MQINHILNIITSPFVIFWQSLLRFRDFSGVSTRMEFWFFTIVMWLLDALFRWVDMRYDLNVSLTNSINYDSATIGISTFIFMSIVILPLCAITVRRLHDIDFKGWWALVWAIPFVGLFSAIVLGFIPTRKNRWAVKIAQPSAIIAKT